MNDNYRPEVMLGTIILAVALVASLVTIAWIYWELSQ